MDQDIDDLIRKAACRAHEMNRIYCKLIGDNSQLSWEECPEMQRESAIKGATYRFWNPNSKPEDSQNSWLPHGQQVKDYLFICACDFEFGR